MFQEIVDILEEEPRNKSVYYNLNSAHSAVIDDAALRIFDWEQAVVQELIRSAQIGGGAGEVSANSDLIDIALQTVVFAELRTLSVTALSALAQHFLPSLYCKTRGREEFARILVRDMVKHIPAEEAWKLLNVTGPALVQRVCCWLEAGTRDEVALAETLKGKTSTELRKLLRELGVPPRAYWWGCRRPLVVMLLKKSAEDGAAARRLAQLVQAAPRSRPGGTAAGQASCEESCPRIVEQELACRAAAPGASSQLNAPAVYRQLRFRLEARLLRLSKPSLVALSGEFFPEHSDHALPTTALMRRLLKLLESMVPLSSAAEAAKLPGGQLVGILCTWLSRRVKMEMPWAEVLSYRDVRDLRALHAQLGLTEATPRSSRQKLVADILRHAPLCEDAQRDLLLLAHKSGRFLEQMRGVRRGVAGMEDCPHQVQAELVAQRRRQAQKAAAPPPEQALAAMS